MAVADPADHRSANCSNHHGCSNHQKAVDGEQLPGVHWKDQLHRRVTVCPFHDLRPAASTSSPSANTSRKLSPGLARRRPTCAYRVRSAGGRRSFTVGPFVGRTGYSGGSGAVLARCSLLPGASNRDLQRVSGVLALPHHQVTGRAPRGSHARPAQRLGVTGPLRPAQPNLGVRPTRSRRHYRSVQT